MDAHEDAILITVDFGPDLLERLLNEGGVAAWNGYIESLYRRNLMPCHWAAGEEPPPVSIGFNFSGLKMAGRNLDGIDLWLCDLDNADLDSASLRGARIGSSPGASFRGARLQGAVLWDISGCDFTGALLDGVVLEDATYDESNPPIALPPELAAICTPIAPWADREEYAFGQPVLQAKATLYHVPRGAD